MIKEEEITKQISPEMEQKIARRAKERAKAARWDLDVAVFFFAILVIIVILLAQGVGIEIVAPSAILGLAMGWLMGSRKGKQAYEYFYNGDISRLEEEIRKTIEGVIEETVEEKVQKEMRKRWQEWR